MRVPVRPSKRWLLAGLCLTSVVLMLLGERSRSLCRLARPLLVPLSHLGTAATVHVRTRAHELTGSTGRDQDGQMAALRQDVLKKQEIIDQLNRKLATLRGWDAQLRKPRPGHRPLTAYSCKLIDAAVVGSEPLPLRDRKLLGAGSRRGVAAGDLVTTRRLLHEFPRALPEGLTVLGRNYLVGRIVDSSAYSATLQLVTDRSFRLPGRIVRLVGPGASRMIYVSRDNKDLAPQTYRHDGKTSSAQAVGQAVAVRADGDGRQIVCRNVPAYHDVRPDDELTTALAAGLAFPLTIGRVVRTEVEKDHPRFVTVYVRPTADLGGLREVYIVLPVAAREGR